MNKLSFKMRILLVSSFSFFLFALLVGQFFRIQILEGDKWRNYAGRQHYIDVVEPFVRGTFYSNTSIKKGHPEIIQKFAFDISKFHLYIDPQAIPPKLKNEISSKLLSFVKPTEREL